MPGPPKITDDSRRLLNISLRLKAGRYLAGHATDDGRAVAITVPELAQHPILRDNGITRNRIEDYEQMKVIDPRPMELEKIAEALGLSKQFFFESVDPSPATVEDAMNLMTEAQAAMRVVARRLGIDIGLRDLQLSASTDRQAGVPQAGP